MKGDAGLQLEEMQYVVVIFWMTTKEGTYACKKIKKYYAIKDKVMYTFSFFPKFSDVIVKDRSS